MSAVVTVAIPAAAQSVASPADASAAEPEWLGKIEVRYAPAPGTVVINTPACTLYADIYRLTGTSDIYGIATTTCSANVASIEHSVYIDRSRWYGWETMASWERHVRYNDWRHTTVLRYYCGGTGIHDYRVRDFGMVIPYGEQPIYAEAGDRINEINCG